MTRTTALIISFIFLIFIGVIYFVVNISSQSPKTPTPPATSPPAETPLTPQAGDKRPPLPVITTLPPESAESMLLRGAGGEAEAIIRRRNEKESGFVIEIIAAKMPIPAENTFYAAWMYKKDEPQEKPVLIGVLEKNTQGTYHVIFSSYTDFSSYNDIMITSERVNDDTPETQILRGSFGN